MNTEQPINTEQPPVKRRKMSAKEEVKTTYYYVSISYPLCASSMDVESLTKVAKKYKINPVGEFDLIGQTFENGVDHEFYLFKFNDSKPASGADDDDFVVNMVNVPTSKILCETGDCMPIDFDLTTVRSAVRSAEEALIKFAGEMFDMVRKKIDHEVIERRITSFVPAVLEHMDPPASVKQATTMEDQLIVVQIQPLTHRIPEDMYNEMFFSQVETYAVRNGLATIIASNKSSVGRKVSRFSQFFHSRPDLIIYHPESDSEVAAYIILCTPPNMESDEEPGESLMTFKDGMTENKLDLKDAVGQLLAGMEKVAADLAYRHLRKDLSVAKRSFKFIHIYGLLCDLRTRKCQAYKLEMDFIYHRSRLLEGLEMFEISEVFPRFIATLKQQAS